VASEMTFILNSARLLPRFERGAHAGQNSTKMGERPLAKAA